MFNHKCALSGYLTTIDILPKGKVVKIVKWEDLPVVSPLEEEEEEEVTHHKKVKWVHYKHHKYFNRKSKINKNKN